MISNLHKLFEYSYKSPEDEMTKTKKKAKDKERILLVLGEMQKILLKAKPLVREIRNQESAIELSNLLDEFQKIYNGNFLDSCNSLKQWVKEMRRRNYRYKMVFENNQVDDSELLKVAFKLKKLIGICIDGISDLIDENYRMVDSENFIKAAKKLAIYVNMITDAKKALTQASDNYQKNLIAEDESTTNSL